MQKDNLRLVACSYHYRYNALKVNDDGNVLERCVVMPQQLEPLQGRNPRWIHLHYKVLKDGNEFRFRITKINDDVLAVIVVLDS